MAASRTVDDAEQMLNETGADGVMIGRASIGNPWIFETFRAALSHREFVTPTLDEKRAMIETHLRRMLPFCEKEHKTKRGKRAKLSPEHMACVRFRAHIVKYLRGFRGIKHLFNFIHEICSIDQLLEITDTIIEHEKKYPLEHERLKLDQE